ncbi:MAG: response regulator protein, partial [Deltaproteobacteria bacterium]|nr:response regulator protein [Deltaproteobacteria bacterium]
DKLSSLGRMAAGIAHEINNPLAGILLYSSNLVKKVPETGPLKKGLEVIIHETIRCRGIIQDLLEFSREREPVKSLADINGVINKALSILANEFRLNRISLEKRLSDNLPNVLIDVNQIEQVFINFFMNAIEAIQGQGQVSVRSYKDEDNQGVVVEIEDSGMGIPQEHLERIFEPFFSTKPKGTGLGLAVNYGIIQKHGGQIRVSSQPGRGTTMTIRLPYDQVKT